MVDGGVAGAYVADIRLEMLHIDRVEADDGGVEADVCFGDCIAEVVDGRIFGRASSESGLEV